MMGLPPKTEIWIAAGVTDLRRGFDGLSALVQTKLEQHPFSGHVFVFRGRRGDLIKLLWWDGDGLVYRTQRLQRERRALRRTQLIRIRLGSTPNTVSEFPPRPKGMHRRTYDRLKTEAAR